MNRPFFCDARAKSRCGDMAFGIYRPAGFLVEREIALLSMPLCLLRRPPGATRSRRRCGKPRNVVIGNKRVENRGRASQSCSAHDL